MTSDKKSCNFSAREIEVLVDSVESSKELLFAKFGGGVSNAAKIDMWRRIAQAVNAVNEGDLRTVEAIKKKWYDMASKTKKKESMRRKDMTVTGGGKCEIVMTAEEVKVVEILGNEAIEGIVGGFDVGLDMMESGRMGLSLDAGTPDTVAVIGEVVSVADVKPVETPLNSIKELKTGGNAAAISGKKRLIKVS